VGSRAVLAAVAAALAVAAAACGGSAGDKAGGAAPDSKPVVLTAGEHDPSHGAAQFAAAVEKRSGGAIRINVNSAWDSEWVDAERRTVEDVRTGKLDLGVVGARVWDTLGVTSFQALLAPFLVDSLGLERRVLESPLPARMLSGVRRAGVVGVAVLPGALRRPFGYLRPLVGPGDYKGARLGVKPGRVEAETLRSLGARTRGFNTLSGASREGAVPDLWTIASQSWRGKTLAGNVVFWPRAETVVVNRKTFEALTPAQRKVLEDAGRDEIGPRLAEIDRVERGGLQTICARRLALVVTASAAQIAGLHAEVKPVYAELEHNARTRRLISEIRKMRNEGSEDATLPLRCPSSAPVSATELEGVWKSSATRGELRTAGASAAEAATFEGPGTLKLRHGRWTFSGEHTTVTGSYAVRRDHIRLTMRTCTVNPCSPGAVTEYAWSVYRDTLSLARSPEGPFWPRLVLKPSRRVE
jgi:TRAP-type C4-dicarboxylate transport system substrate-binding protein